MPHYKKSPARARRISELEFELWHLRKTFVSCGQTIAKLKIRVNELEQQLTKKENDDVDID